MGNRVPSGIYGTTWTYPNGNLGFGLNGQLTGFQVKVIEDASGFRAELVNKVPVPTSQSNDAASNALVVPKTDLKVEKVLKGIDNGVATWEIKVINEGPCGSSGFNVNDLVPNSYRNVRITQTTAGWVSNSLQPQVNGQQVVALHGPLRKGESASLTLQANVASSTNGCVENTASVLGNEGDDTTANNTASDGGCSLDIRKDVVDVDNNGVIDAKDSAAPGPNGTRTISYDIVVSNPKDGTRRTYSLSDTPRFANLVSITGGKVSSPVLQPSSKDLSGAGPWELARGVTIAPGDSHRYRVEVYYKPPSSDVSREATAQCIDGKPDNGLFNTANAAWDGGQKKDEACAPITNDRDVTLKVKKLNADGGTTPLTGAQFSIHAVNPDGSLGSRLKPLDAADQNGFYTAVLKPNTQYFLVENQSPEGFMLLPAPVKFSVSLGASDRDSARISVLSDSLAIESTPLENSSPTIAYMNVSDVHKGDLPKTGGSGYYQSALAGMLLTIFGLLFLIYRRNTA
nr:LPXTG cell wall anchor domain-containing protein [Corynebacterium sp. HMSC28B08]